MCFLIDIILLSVIISHLSKMHFFYILSSTKCEHTVDFGAGPWATFVLKLTRTSNINSGWRCQFAETCFPSKCCGCCQSNLKLYML